MPSVTVTIVQSFTAYPGGRKTRYAAGQTPTLDYATAKLWKTKGLVSFTEPGDAGYRAPLSPKPNSRRSYRTRLGDE